MRLKISMLLVLGGLAGALPAVAQEDASPATWRSSLVGADWTPPHERQQGLDFRTDRFIQDFSYAGYHRGEKPLPVVEGPLFDVVADYGADLTGETDSTAAIQAALDDAKAAGGGVVWLPEGFYRLTVGPESETALSIEGDNIVLRGAGSSRTFLFNTTYKMRGKSIIRAGNPAADWGKAASAKVKLRQDYPGPTIELALESVSGFQIDDWVAVHNPDTEAFVHDINMGPGSDGVDWTGELPRPLIGPRAIRQISAINHKERIIRLDAPTRWALLTRDEACVYKVNDHAFEVGLEGFSYGNKRHPGKDGWGEGDYRVEGSSAYDVHDSYAIRIGGVINGWMRDVHTFNPGNDNGAHVLSNALQVLYARGLTITNCAFRYVQYGGGGGNGYAIRLNSASECLVIDTEVGHCRHGLVTWRMENSGNVFLRNYDHHTGRQLGDGSTPQPTRGAGSDHHGWFSHSNLFDSNRLDQSYLQAAYRGDYGGGHGMTAAQIVYWNNIGLSYPSNGYIVHSEQFGHGYVIGTRGPTPWVRLTENRQDSASRTDPVDFTEGIGKGETLTPASLYLFQLQRRFSLLRVPVPKYIQHPSHCN